MQTFDKSNAPQRILTGIRKTTLPFYTDTFYGDPEDYDFGKQAANYRVLRDVLAGLNLKFTAIGVRNITVKRPQWVAYVGDPNNAILIWEKYEGTAAMAAQKRIYVNGQLWKQSSFLMLSNSEQEALIEPCELRRFMRKTLTTEEQRMQHG